MQKNVLIASGLVELHVPLNFHLPRSLNSFSTDSRFASQDIFKHFSTIQDRTHVLNLLKGNVDVIHLVYTVLFMNYPLIQG